MSERLSVISIANRIPDEAAAYLFLEEMRWGKDHERLLCPHCGSTRAGYLNPENGSTRKTRTGSASARRVWKCKDANCRKQFSVLTGTIFHGTKISVRTWCFVLFEMVANKNGISAREIERKYDVTAKSAWFMTQRIREAMRNDSTVGMFSGVVIADETWIGGLERNRHKNVRPPRVSATTEPERIVPGERQKMHGSPTRLKTPVLSLIDKTTGEVRSRVVPDVTGATLRKAIAEQVDMPNTTLYTDDARAYKTFSHEFAEHQTVNHTEEEYVRYQKGRVITTNQAEGYFSQLKRSLDGTHHHVSTKHLHRYLAEFDFRHSTRKLTDTARFARLIGQVEGRRLTYRPLTTG